MLKAFYQDRLEELVSALKVFEELNPPKIDPSGNPLFYQVSVERFLEDPKLWGKLNSDSNFLIKNLSNCLEQPIFKELSHLVVEYAEKYRKKQQIVASYYDHGWLFSCAYAKLVQKKNVLFFKDQAFETLYFDKNNTLLEKNCRNLLENKKLLLIGDILNQDLLYPKGLITLFEVYKTLFKDVIYIFSYNNGGEKLLKAHNLKPHSLIKFGVKFLERHCSNKNLCIAYWKNSIATSTMYLRKNGALEFLQHFDPSASQNKKHSAYIFYIHWLEPILTNHQITMFADAIKSHFQIAMKDLLEDFKLAKPAT